MPRSRKKKPAKPIAVSSTLTHLKDEIPGLKSAVDLPRQLPSAEPELLPLPKAEQASNTLKLDPKLLAEFTAATADEPLRSEAPPPERELIERDGNFARPRPSHEIKGTEQDIEPGPHAAAVIASRPNFRPVPTGFVNLDSYPAAGIKLNRSRDKTVLAVQFADDKLPSREEKDFLQVRGVNYDPPTKQWTRRDAEAVGANAIDAKGIAAELTDGRRERGR